MNRLLIHSLLPLLTFSTLLFVGCSDSTTDPDNDGTVEEITAPYYIQASLNGKVKTVQQQSTSSNLVDMGFSSFEGTASNDVDFVSIQRTFFTRVVPTGGIPVLDSTNTFYFSFIKNYDKRITNDDDYDLMIRKGSTSFGSEADEKDGVEIRWVDANGKSWSTAYGSGNQANSSFVITKKVKIEYPQPWLGDRILYEIEGTFSCTLYDSSGNSMQVTEGKFSLKAVLV
ncbi:MAG: hypothetical protein KDD67_12560 [Ignavibacteriae bacterium]|nr:hypothetical protein [Ignavibacteriota bacterium]MCB9214306.1 hypothetical protein [Ignavibacteria bacterium]